jgi:hypothetical protein
VDQAAVVKRTWLRMLHETDSRTVHLEQAYAASTNIFDWLLKVDCMPVLSLCKLERPIWHKVNKELE